MTVVTKLLKKIRTETRLLRGVFPVYKDKDMCTMDVLKLLRLQINYELGFSTNYYGIKIGAVGSFDKTARGILICGIDAGFKYLKLFNNGTKSYKVKACLGTATDTCDATGNIIQTKSVDHITKAIIDEEVKKYNNSYIKFRNPPKFKSTVFANSYDWLNDFPEENILVEKSFVSWSQVSCTEFQSPFVSLNITGYGGLELLFIQTFVNSLGKALGTCAHVTDIERTEYGPFVLEDALQKYDWSLDNIQKLADKLSEKKDEFVAARRKILTKRKGFQTDLNNSDLCPQEVTNL